MRTQWEQELVHRCLEVTPDDATVFHAIAASIDKLTAQMGRVEAMLYAIATEPSEREYEEVNRDPITAPFDPILKRRHSTEWLFQMWLNECQHEKESTNAECEAPEPE